MGAEAAQAESSGAKYKRDAWRYVDWWFADNAELLGKDRCIAMRTQIAWMRAEAVQRRIPLTQVAESIQRDVIQDDDRRWAAILLIEAKEFAEGTASWVTLDSVHKPSTMG